jgi:hypothetical protein
MSRSISLVRSSRPHNEAVSLFDDHTWTSPAGGWLSPRRGRWNQFPQGVYLEPDSGTERIAELRGFIFLTSLVNDSGVAYLNRLGDGGAWVVVE